MERSKRGLAGSAFAAMSGSTAASSAVLSVISPYSFPNLEY